MKTSAREALLDRLRAILVCPDCHTKLDVAVDATGGASPGAFACSECGKEGQRLADRFHFGGFTDEEESADWLNNLKWKAKKNLGKYYPKVVNALSPVYGDTGIKTFLEGFKLERDIVCDLGAGTRTYDDRVVCVDGYAYDTVHLVGDIGALPFADASVDGVISEAVLEHVPDPTLHVKEMLRVLRPGGRLLCYFPFMVGFHASPHDYTRLTLPGLQRLFADFDVRSTVISGGPTSGMLWTLQEWLAMMGSFGNERLYRALVPVTWLLSPLKYIDVVLIRHPAAHVIASGFTIQATKKEAS